MAEGKAKIGRPPLTKKKGKTFSGYFDPDLLAALKADAEKEKRSINNHVEYILENYLKEKGVM